ncbi:MAG: ABC transporter ATP-binding protein/permease [Bdellovibrionaceae bacterium]|nr:ABC transporter ATP-binding protein/permease [Pseudobdellovibrionaceae bacterium]
MSASFNSIETSDNTNHWKTLKTFGSYLWPENRWDLRLRVLLALFFLVLAKVLNIYVPFLLKQTIDIFSQTISPLTLPLSLIIAYGVARLGVALFGELRDFIFAKVGQNAQRVIALNTFKHLHSLSLQFHLSRQTGGLSRVIERGTRGIQFVLNFMTFNILPTLLEIVLVTGAVIYHFGFLYGLIIFSTITIYIFLTISVTEWRLKFRKSMNSAETSANTKAIDSLLNFETVKYFGNEEHEYYRFDLSLAKYEKAAVTSQMSLSVLNITQAAVISLGLIAVMWMAGQGVINKVFTVGDFVLINTFLIQLYLPLNFLGFVYREIKNSLVDMDKMFELIQVHSDVADDPNAQDLMVTKGVVEFKDVQFGYSQNRQILKGVNFKIGAGQTLAIVGSSGAGKSTIARLLFRFYDVTDGQITIDGQDIRHVTQKSLRQNIGVVPQDTVLFNDSIGYNIFYGKPDATEEQMHKASHMAKIHDFIASLPQGYDTPVGERGLKLSGGEKQRVAIARTILKNPPILIFDEATSALDSHKEKEIQASLQEISTSRSTLVIAHRLSTVVNANEIIVLQDGQVAERGTHSQLLKKRGLYASMWFKQQEEQSHSVESAPET